MDKPLKIVEIWVELDEFIYPEGKPADEDYCNVTVYLSDGACLELNIWSEKFFYEQVNELDWIDNRVAELPDLVVRQLDSDSIRKVILDLEEKERWFQGRGYPASRVG